MERAAKSLGREVACDEHRVIDPEPTDATTLYLGIDGTGIPMRATECVGRPGKRADGEAGTREVKLAVVWSAEGTDRHGRPMKDPGSSSYNAAIESAAVADTAREPSVFARRVDREANRRMFEQADRRVVMGDAAKWIWNLSSELFPDAIEIVDLYHVKEHLGDIANEIYGKGSNLAGQWRQLRYDELEDDQLDAVVAAL